MARKASHFIDGEGVAVLPLLNAFDPPGEQDTHAYRGGSGSADCDEDDASAVREGYRTAFRSDVGMGARGE